MSDRQEIEMLKRIYNGAFKTKLQERLDAELAEERAGAAINEEDEACAEDICERDFGYCKWCGRSE